MGGVEAGNCGVDTQVTWHITRCRVHAGFRFHSGGLRSVATLVPASSPLLIRRFFL